MDSSPRTLSSAETFFTKVLFPPLWIGGLAAATLSLFLAPGLWHGPDAGPPDPEVKWLLLVATIVSIALIWSTAAPLNQARMDDKPPDNSNNSTQIVVP